MVFGNNKLFLIIPLFVLIYVPIRIQGFDATFWIFSLDLNAMGEKGIIWHCYALLRYMNWVYVVLELIVAYALFFVAVYLVRLIRKTRG